MAWFGESFANIKGQISSFTKEVLTEGSEENEEFIDSEELRSAKKLIGNLETTCTGQNNEIEQLRLQIGEFEEKTQAQDSQIKSLGESYETLLQCKEDENRRLREQVDSLLLKQQQYKKEFELIKNNEEVLVKDSSSGGAKPDDVVQPVMRDVATEAEPTADEEDFLSYRLELEERCASYQNDLFLLREELINLQHNVGEKEIQSAKLSEDIFILLNSDFTVDGQPALKSKQKQSNYPFGCSDTGEDIIISALKQLASIWKDLVDRKATLERTVTKLSLAQSQSATSATQLSSGDGSAIHRQEDEYNEEDIVSSTAGSSASNFYPPKVDLFGLETIIEDERGEEDNRLSENEFPLNDQPSCIAFIHKSKSSPRQVQAQRRSSISFTSSSSQTDEPENSHSILTSLSEKSQEDLLSQKVEELDLKWVEKEKTWISRVEERDLLIKKIEAELERLKTHLVDFEEQATSEALVNEEREKHLRIQVAQLKTQIVHTLEENDRAGDLREEVHRLTAERDVARVQNSSLEDQIQKLSLQLQNLHFVLEQFQKEKETEIGNIEKILREEINHLKLEKSALETDITVKEGLLEKARSGLDAAQQLSGQIEEKTRLISVLKTQVQNKETEVVKLTSQVKEVGSNLDGKVDRYLLKNLIVGYFSTPTDKRAEVLRIIATVLDFNREDRQKTGLEAVSIWPFRGESSATENKPSLSEAFIRFLENESQPKVNVRIPAEEMARRSSRSSSSFTVSGESSVPRSNSPATANTVVGGVPEISLSLPVFNQADRSNSILKDVLNPKP